MQKGKKKWLIVALSAALAGLAAAPRDRLPAVLASLLGSLLDVPPVEPPAPSR